MFDRRRTRRTVASGVAALALAMAGCSRSGEGAEPCEVLRRPAPALVEQREQRVADGLTALFDALGPTTEVVIYLDPASPDELAELAAAALEQPGVVEVEEVDQATTYEAFLELFEDQPEMLETVLPEDLPTSVKVEVDRDEVAALMAWAKARPTTYDVIADADVEARSLAAQMSFERARREWRRIADDLEEVAGDPAWASAGALAVRTVLEEGLDDALGATEVTEAIAEAEQDLADAIEACEPD